MDMGKMHEINWARTLKLPKGSFVCFDRGFTYYALYNDLSTCPASSGNGQTSRWC